MKSWDLQLLPEEHQSWKSRWLEDPYLSAQQLLAGKGRASRQKPDKSFGRLVLTKGPKGGGRDTFMQHHCRTPLETH